MTIQTRSKKVLRAKEFPNQNKSWTSEEDLKLLDLYKTKTYEEIGKIIGRTPNSCSCRIHALNNNTAKNPSDSVANNGKVWTWDDDQLLLELNHKGRTNDSIARQMKRTEVSVSGRLQSLKKMGRKYKDQSTKPQSLVPIDEYKATHPDFRIEPEDPSQERPTRKKRNDLPEVIRKEIVDRYRRGEGTKNELAKKYDVSVNAIYSWDRKYQKGHTEVWAKKLNEMDEKDETSEQFDIRSIIDQFKGMKGTTILVIQQS